MIEVTTPAAADVVPLRRWREQRRPILALVAAYLLARVLHLLLLWQGTGVVESAPDSAVPEVGAQPRSLYDTLAAWDGGWYVRIARDGYPDAVSLVSVRDDASAPLAFPPLYPMLMRLLGVIGLPEAAAGLLLSAVAGVVAVVGVYAVARDLVRPGAAWLTAALWAAGPMTIVLSMVYAEALFVALASWALWCARRRWWLTAGLLGLLAGLTRSTGLAVGVALLIAGALALRADRIPHEAGAASGSTGGGQSRWRVLLGVALAVAGVPLWWLYVAIVGGRIDAWFAVQEFFWGSRFDFGAAVLENGWRMLTFDGRFDAMTRLVYTLSFFAVLGSVLLLAALLTRAWRARDRALRWWPVAGYAATLVVLAAGSAGYPHSKLRFLIPMFPLLLLPATWLERCTRVWQAVSLVVLAVATGWLGAFMLAVWPYTI